MKHDPAMTGSQFARIENDAYHTIEAKMAIDALLDSVPVTGPVLEPAAGRGHLVWELRDNGFEVDAYDLIKHANPLIDDIRTNCDLMIIRNLKSYDALVTNLPYDRQDEMLAHLLPIAARDKCMVATLARSTWCLPANKRPLFFDHPNAMAVVHLPRRPRWVPKQPGDEAPRHEYSWYVWSAEPHNYEILTYAPKEHID